MVQSAKEHTTTKRWYELTAEEICQIANSGEIYAGITRKPNGTSGIYWIVSKRPYMKFLVPERSERWMKIEEAASAGKLHELDDPEFQGIVAGKAHMHKLHGLTEDRLKEMTMRFDEFGEFQTDSLEMAQRAFRAVFGCDHSARMHHESKELKPWDSSLHMRKSLKEEFEPHFFENKIQDEKKNPPKK